MSENDPKSAGAPPPRKSPPAGLSDWADPPADLLSAGESPSEPVENVMDSHSWAELPRLEVSDQVSGSMAFVLPGKPSLLVPPPPPTAPDEVIPPPPGMIVLTDDFAGLSRLSKSKFGVAGEPLPKTDPALSNGEHPAFRLPEAPGGDVTTTTQLRPSGKSRGEIGLPPAPPPPFRVEQPPPGPDSPARTLRPSELRLMHAGSALPAQIPAPPVIERPGPIVYGMVLRNPTSVPMFDVSIEHDLPDGPAYLGAEPEPIIEGRRLVWDLGTVEPGSKHKFRIRIQPAHAGDLSEDATAVFRVRQCLESRTRILRPSLNVTLTVPESAATGERVPLAVEMRNAGPGAAHDVRVLIALPDGMAFPGGTQPQLQRPRLGAGESCRFDAEAFAERAGGFAVQAHVVAGGKVAAVAQVALTATPPEIHLRVEGPPRVVVGEPFDCRLDVSNLGQDDLDAVQASLRLPAGLDIIERAGGEFAADDRRLGWHFNSLPPRESRSLGVRLRATRAGEFVIPIEASDGRGHRAAVAKALVACAPDFAAPEALAESRLFVAFALADQAFGVPAGNVREVCRPLPVTPRRDSPDWLRGTVSVRGEVLPLVDLRRFLDLPPGEPGHVLIARAGDITAALLVDAIAGIRYLTLAAVVETSGRLAEFAAGSAESDGRRLVLLDVEKMLRCSELGEAGL